MSVTLPARHPVLTPQWVKNELWRRARAVPSLDLRFAETKSLVDATTGTNLVDFTRASSGTYVGSDGLIKTATTNLLLRSEEFDQSPWTPTNGTVTTNQVTAPNGSTTADLIAATATAAYAGRVTQAVTGVTANNYSISVYAKAGSSNFVAIGFVDTGFGNARGYFDLSTATSSSTSTAWTVNNTYIQNVGNGWYRCVMQISVGSTDGSVDAQIYSVNGLSTNDVTSGNSVYLWGAQLEQSSTVGEYVKTTSTINSAPRFDHDPTTGESLGLLVEESRTNLVTWSQDFSQTDWSKNASTIVATAVASPIQGVNYQKIEATSANTTVGITSVAVTAATQQRVVSFFAQPLGSMSRVLVVVQGADARININLADGTFTTNTAGTGSTVSVSGQRFSVSTPTLTNATGVRFFLKRTGETDTSTPTTIAIGEGLYLIGAQMEAGSFPTSYIPTTASAATRAADVASISGSNFSSWYRQDEGTVFADSTFAVTNNTRIAAISNNTATNRIILNRGAGSSGNFNMSVTNTTAQVSGLVLATALAAGTSNRVAAVYKASDFAGSVNGLTAVTQNTGTVPSTVTQLGVGTGEVLGSNTMTGTIRRLTYWPQRLPNETLQGITQ